MSRCLPGAIVLLLLFLLSTTVIRAETPILRSTAEYIKDLSTGRTLNITKPVLKAGIPIEVFVELRPTVRDVSLISRYAHLICTTPLEDARWIITFFFLDGTYKERRFAGSEAKTWDVSLHEATTIQIRVSGRTPQPIISSIEPYTGLVVGGVARKEITLLNVSLYEGEPGLIYGGKYQYTVYASFAVVTTDAIETALSQLKESEGKIPPDAGLSPVFNKLYEMASKGHPGWAAEIARSISNVPLFEETREYCNRTVCAPIISDLRKSVSSFAQKADSLSKENSELKKKVRDLQNQMLLFVILAAAVSLIIGVFVGISRGRGASREERERLREIVESATRNVEELRNDMDRVQQSISRLYEAPSSVIGVIRPTLDELFRAHRSAMNRLDALRGTLRE